MLDQIAKENSLGRIVSSSGSSFDTISISSRPPEQKEAVEDLLGLVEQLAQFVEFRHQMMKL